MKKIAIVGLVACFGFAFVYKPNVTLDTYKVIKVTGSILYKKTNKSMLQGDLFPENEQILFKTTDSKAAIISTAKGRFILAPGAEKKDGCKSKSITCFFQYQFKKWSCDQHHRSQKCFHRKLCCFRKMKNSYQ